MDIIEKHFRDLGSWTTLASAVTVDPSAATGQVVNITGTATITSFGTGANLTRFIRFAGALTLTHNGTSLVLPGGVSITTAAGDKCVAISDASGNWHVFGYHRATGKALVPATLSEVGGGTLSADVSLSGVGAGRLFAVSGEGATTATFSRFTTDAFGAYTYMRKARGTTASPTVLASGDQAGGVFVQGYTGAAFVTLASVTASVIAATPSGTDMQSRITSLVVPAGSVTASIGTYLDSFGLRPITDNVGSCGTASLRWTQFFAATATVGTSDAREKTSVWPLTEAEIAAAIDLAGEIGTFQFLDAVAAKGPDGARHHVGMTVQRAIEIMTGHGLDPLRYGFICHDTWDAEPYTPAVEPVPAVIDEDGNEITPEIPGAAAIPGYPAGDRYGFRGEELLLFIARGQAARQASLEARIAALEAHSA